MIVINSIDEKYFELNSIQYARIYQPLNQGSTAIGIYNIYDTRQQLLNSTNYLEFIIDGTVYASQSETIAALLDIIWSSNIEEKTEVHQIAIAASTVNVSDSINAIWTTQGTSFELPYDCEIVEVRLALKSLDGNVIKGTFNLQIKGQVANLFDADVNLDIAASADGSGGIILTNVNTLYSSGLQWDMVLFKIVAGLDGDAGDLMVKIKTRKK